MKRLLQILVVSLFVFMARGVSLASNEQQMSTRSNELIVGLFSTDLFEGNEVFAEAIRWLNDEYPYIKVNYHIFKRELITTEDFSTIDILFVNENYHIQSSEMHFLKNLWDSELMIDLQDTSVGLEIKEGLYDMEFLLDIDEPLLFVPIKVYTTTLRVDTEIYQQAIVAGFPENVEELFLTWTDLARFAEAFAQADKEHIVFFLEDIFSDLPVIAHQIAAYLHTIEDLNDIDETAIIENLQALKRLSDVAEIDFVNTADGSRENIGLFTSTISLFQFGEDYYVKLPRFSATTEIYPANGVLAGVSKNSPNSKIAIEFLSTLLSSRCQNVYNVMGVVRKDATHAMIEGYEIFAAPEYITNDIIYIDSLRYAAFPFLDYHDEIAYQEVIAQYLNDAFSAQETCSRLIALTIKP